MNENCTFIAGGTGLRPVVSGVPRETWGVARALGGKSLRNVHRRFAGEIRRDAGFNRPEAYSTIVLA